MALEFQKNPNVRLEYALKRACQLKEKINPYLENSESIPHGFALTEEYIARRTAILQYFGARLQDWNDWRWQRCFYWRNSQACFKHGWIN